MSKTTDPTTDEQTATESADEPKPACGTNLTGRRTEWQTKDAAVYPPGYPRLCSDEACFGEQFRNHAEQDCGRLPGYDHREDLDTLLQSSGGNNTAQRHHRPAKEGEDD